MKFTRFFTFFIILFFLVTAAEADSAFFPKQELTFGFYSNDIVHADPWRPPSPIFWDSTTNATSGGTIIYTRILYHTQKYFSASWGVEGSVWHDNVDNATIGALTALIELRWWIFRTSCFNPYLVYSVAAPTLLTNHTFGEHSSFSAPFLWQDYLGFGILFGKNHHFDLSARMYHYSNGDMFVRNDGFDVPLVIMFGFNF